MSDDSNRTELNRRTFLQSAGLTVAAAAATGCAETSKPRPRNGANRKPTRNVIFMVADGMSTGTLTLGDMVLREQHGLGSSWLELLKIPGARRALAKTHSADAWVTDSAAGGCAWSIGTHINNGAINYTPGEQMLSPIGVRAKARGLSVGLVTTTRVTHATPASFIANVPKRSQEDAIAAHILERGVDVCFGGGTKHFSDELLARHAGVSYHTALPSLASAEADSRHLALFADSHLPYGLDRESTIPSLGAMTSTALGHLARNSEGFLLQVEGGRVDHAAHGNDAAALVDEQLEYEDALRVAMEFALSRDDTLLITTSDHGNANPGMTLYNNKADGLLERLTGATRSFDYIMGSLRDAVENNTLRELLAEATGGFEATEGDLKYLRRGFVDNLRTDAFRARSGAYTSLLGSMLANYHGVAFLSPNHTADMVEVAAIGPGAELLEPVIDNIDLHEIMTRVLRLKDTSPMG